MAMMTEEKAQEILMGLINKPDVVLVDIPRIFGEIIDVYNKTFNPPVVEEPKKKKRKRAEGSRPIGWPLGVGRAEYKAWADNQREQGVTTNINGQRYKELRDNNLLEAERADGTPFPKATKKKNQPPMVLS